MEQPAKVISLNDLIAKHQEITAMIIEAEGVLTPEIEAAIAENEMGVSAKLDSYARYIGFLEGQEEYLKSTAKQYTDRARTLSNVRECLRERMVWAMKEVGETKIKTAEHNYSLRDTVSWVFDADASDSTKQELAAHGMGKYDFKPDMKSIKDAYKGDGVPEFIEVIPKTSITIR